jgi:hypothetical protein
VYDFYSVSPEYFGYTVVYEEDGYQVTLLRSIHAFIHVKTITLKAFLCSIILSIFYIFVSFVTNITYSLYTRLGFHRIVFDNKMADDGLLTKSKLVNWIFDMC